MNRPCMLEWKNVNIEVVNTNRSIKSRRVEIIKNSSGIVREGELLAIMGPSGGGKTTLLSCLSGNVPINARTQGIIEYNQKERGDDWLQKIGFVNQNDVVYENLSVRETLQYAALFRRAYKKSSADRSVSEQLLCAKTHKMDKNKLNFLINNTIADLHLTSCANNQIAKLSGGERKRVMIGIELITQPDILFLDEPTSGLDTLTALKIIGILKSLAINRNKIIITTIHQPSTEIFMMFNSLILLDRGVTLYNGPTSGVESHFEGLGIKKRDLITIPEFVLEVCSEDFHKENPELFYTEQTVLKEKTHEKCKKIQKTKNDLYLNFSLNYQHIALIFKRKVNMELSKKTRFVKCLLSRLALYVIMGVMICSFYNFIMNNPADKIEWLQDLVFKGKYRMKSLRIEDEVIAGVLRELIAPYILYILIFSQMSTITSYFINEIDVLKKEISIESYSSGSLYLSSLLYLFCYETICVVLFLPVFLFMSPTLLSSGILCICFAAILSTLPMALFIASVTSSKQINKFLSSIVSSIVSFSPSIIGNCLSYLGEGSGSDIKSIIKALSLVTIALPQYHFSSLMVSIIQIESPQSENPHAQAILDIFKDSNKKNLYGYMAGLKFTQSTVFLMFIFSNLMYVFLGMIYLGYLLMPDLRYSLEKKIPKKSQ